MASVSQHESLPAVPHKSLFSIMQETHKCHADGHVDARVVTKEDLLFIFSGPDLETVQLKTQQFIEEMKKWHQRIEKR